MGNSATLGTPASNTARIVSASVNEPYYYLHNFATVLGWVLSHHRDLLLTTEIHILEGFSALPLKSQALLVRMIMRKGSVFRASKLNYGEIGFVQEAVGPLVAQGWVERDGSMDVAQLFTLLTRQELRAAFGNHLPARGRKFDWLEALKPLFPSAQRFSEWYAAAHDDVYTLLLMPLCDRLRLMFFGNLRQDWSEFILADLGVYRYEKVEFSDAARAFRSRGEIDAYLQLDRCRERFEVEGPAAGIVEELLQLAIDNPWLERRRAKLLFRIGQHCEREGHLEQALSVYSQTRNLGVRARSIRVLERLGRVEQALSLCAAAMLSPESEQETQQLQRMLPRLQRHLGTPTVPRRNTTSYERIDLLLPRPALPFSVEAIAQTRLHRDKAPVYYVENTLINSLFGLLCWEAVFAAVPGAFFHPFQHGPADLLSPDFCRLRDDLFERLLAQLDTGDYRATILRNYQAKQGLQSPFVFWSELDDKLLELALACMSAVHLRRLFDRLLTDISANRAGLPDLIQFWPDECRYRLIEVKGPGDRLQDNQVRWLNFCTQHGIPIAVCYVQWQDKTE